MHNNVKWPNILQKSCVVHTAIFLKYAWPFYNIMHERVDGALIVGGEGVVGLGRKFYLGPAEIESFSSQDFSESNAHDTF